MKKLLMVTMIALTSLTSFGQLQKLQLTKSIKVGEIKPVGVFIADVSYYVSEVDGSQKYTLTYRNGKYAQIDDYKELKFNADSATINELYKLFSDAFTAEDIKKYEQTIQLGKSVVQIKGYKMMGMKGVQFFVTSESNVFSYINPINETQLKNLFGKSN
jgi:hypothetical protein